MGQFSYDCTKCGKHSQFDWITVCVVKVGALYVRGRYDGYGAVEIEVASRSGGGKREKRTVRAYLWQHCEFFKYWSLANDDLVATQIFCDGEAGEEHHNMGSLHAMLLGGVDPHEADDRHCVPDGIDVEETLSEPVLAELPKAVEVEASKATAKQSKAISA